MYTEIDLNTGEKWSFKVIGILRRKESYPSLFIMGLNNALDYRYIRLIDKEALKSFANIDMALGSKVVFSDNVSKVKKIEQLSDEYNLFDMNYRTVSSNTSYYLKGFMTGLYIALGLLIVLIIILFILSGSKLSLIIKRNFTNYLIRICCGATVGDIHISFLIQMTCLDVIAIIPTIYFAYNNQGNILGIILALLCSFGLNSLIISSTFKKCSMSNISELIRRG